MNRIVFSARAAQSPAQHHLPALGPFALIVIAAWTTALGTGGCLWAAPVAWDNSAGTFDQRWIYQFNWNPDIVPTSTSDTTLTAITPNLRIDAEGTSSNPSGQPFGDVFHDPALTANSLTISTHNAFTVDGRISYGFLVTGITTLTLTSGDLTRQDVASEEGSQLLDMNVRLAADSLWDIGGSGVLSVTSISESGGPRTFTKIGPGKLSTGNGALISTRGAIGTSGAKTISQGIFEGRFLGTGVATIAPGAAFHVASGSTGGGFGPPTTSPVILNGSGSGSTSMLKVGTGVGEISGPLSIAASPNIAVDPGGTLLLSGGITSVNNSGFGLFGPGELVLSGSDTGSILADVRGGQLTIAHDSALGAGSVFLQNNFGFGASLAFTGGVTFANPISLIQGTIRGLGNSTVSSNITLFPFFAANHTLDVADSQHTLAFTGSIADFGSGASLTKTGAGTVALTGNNTIIGGVTVAEGVLANHGAIAGGATNVTGNSLVIGSGQFGDVNLQDNGRLSPGASASVSVFSAATVAVEDLVFDSPTTALLIQLGGAAPGVGHDQLVLSGNATLAGALNVTLASGFSLGLTQSFLMLDVTGTRSGQFAGLGEGALVGNFGGKDLFITYAAGNGNDVALFTQAGLPGDYNGNGTVDAADYVVWRNGGPLQNEGASIGTVDAADYTYWRSHFGQTAGSGAGTVATGSASAVPEPTLLALIIAATVGSCLRRGRVS